MSVDLFLGLGVGALAAVVVMMVLDAYRLLSRFPEECESQKDADAPAKSEAPSVAVECSADKDSNPFIDPVTVSDRSVAILRKVIRCEGFGFRVSVYAEFADGVGLKHHLIMDGYPVQSEEEGEQVALLLFDRWQRGEL